MASIDDTELIPIPMNDGLFRHDIYQPHGYILPRAYRPLHKPILNLLTRDDDVWVVTHPKCGTTWASEMVWLLRNNLDYEAAKEDLGARVPFVEFSSLCLNHASGEDEVEKLRETLPKRLSDSVGFVDQFPTSRTIKSHLPWELLPKALRRQDSAAKIIYVAREAKDVCISFYHHHKLLEDYKGSFEEFAELFLDDKLMYGPFWKHLLGFWKRKDQENTLFLKYEDMKKDLSLIIRQVNSFLNLAPLSDEQIQGLNNHLSFKSMRDNNAVNMSTFKNHLVETGVISKNVSGHFIRKGIVGDWERYMSSDMVRRFDEWSATHTTGSGLAF